MPQHCPYITIQYRDIVQSSAGHVTLFLRPGVSEGSVRGGSQDGLLRETGMKPVLKQVLKLVYHMYMYIQLLFLSCVL